MKKIEEVQKEPPKTKEQELREITEQLHELCKVPVEVRYKPWEREYKRMTDIQTKLREELKGMGK